MKERIVRGAKKCSCGNVTHIQIYDFVNHIWIWYCKKCQSTIGDPISGLNDAH